MKTFDIHGAARAAALALYSDPMADPHERAAARLYLVAPQPDLSRLSDEEVEILRALMTKATTPATDLQSNKL